MAKYPHNIIHASGMDVGLPDGQMGNSEVGHEYRRGPNRVSRADKDYEVNRRRRLF